MGDFRVRPIKDNTDRARALDFILDDIKALEIMINEGMLDKSHPKIGAEQEMCLLKEDLLPAKNALEILDKINDPHYTNELALFNMEAN
ncbi:MAG: CBS domain-containing protein, partial [Bacteroidia bacterium]|nr:CBS domain-containing protein [Bacteroidia bacterium]